MANRNQKATNIEQAIEKISEQSAKEEIKKQLEDDKIKTSTSIILSKILALLNVEYDFEKFEEALLGTESEWKRRTEILHGRGAMCQYNMASLIREYAKKHRTHIPAILGGLMRHTRDIKNEKGEETPRRTFYQLITDIEDQDETAHMELLNQGRGNQG
jgi:hypothetical protein